MSNVEWRAIPSLPEYMASSNGTVMRVPFYKAMPHGGIRKYGGEETLGVLSEGRRRFVFRNKNYKVHRLVCEAFHGPAPFPKAVVMHINERSDDNRPENLRWGTQRENLNAPGFIKYCRGRTGENSPIHKSKMRPPCFPAASPLDPASAT